MVASVYGGMKSASEAKKYFTQDGYYIEGSDEQEKTMTWHGKGAAAMGLEGKTVTGKDLLRLLEGYVPGKEEPLGRKNGKENNHFPATDLTLSAPKSVSMLIHINGDESVLEAHRAAVKTVIDYVEKHHHVTREKNPDTGRYEYVRGQGAVVAAFEHDISRRIDPQTHTHLLFANLALGPDGKWKCAHNAPLFDNQKQIGAIYHAELAANIMELGYGVKKTGDNGIFEVTDQDGEMIYSKETLDHFSKRTKEIDAALLEKGYDLHDQRARDRAVLMTRDKKIAIERDDLQEIWREQAQDLGLDMGLIDLGIAADREIEKKSALDTTKWATRHLEERHSVFTRNDLIREALSCDPGHVRVADVEAAITDYAKTGPLIEAKLGFEAGFTTQKNLDIEKDTIERALASKGTAQPIVSMEVVSQYLEGSELTPGQMEAVKKILTSEDKTIGVQGYAGSGKTTMLNTVRELYEHHSDDQIIGLAPTKSAAEILEQEAGIDSNTLSSFLAINSSITEGRAKQGFINKLKEDVEGKIIVVDEASMISAADMRDFLCITDVLEPARVVIQGDTKQLQPVEAGQPFKQLQQAGMETVVMENNLRQRTDKQKAVVAQELSGNPTEAIKLHGDAIIEVEKDKLAAEAAANFLGLPFEDQENTAVMAQTRKMRGELNEKIRDGLAEERASGNTTEINHLVSLNLTEAERELSNNYHPGQVVKFESGLSSRGIKSGETLEITGNKNGEVYLKAHDGREVTFDPSGGIASRLGVYEAEVMELREGDKIRWTRNDKEMGLINTQKAEITAIDDNGMVHIKTQDGREMELPKDAPQLQHSDHAYAGTVHSYQGSTVDKVIATMESTNKHQTNQNTLYTIDTRPRDGSTIFTDSKEQLAFNLEQNTGDKMTAHDAVGKKLTAGKSVEERSQAVIEDTREQAGLNKEQFEMMLETIPEPEEELSMEDERQLLIDQIGYYIEDSKESLSHEHVAPEPNPYAPPFGRTQPSSQEYEQNQTLGQQYERSTELVIVNPAPVQEKELTPKPPYAEVTQDYSIEGERAFREQLEAAAARMEKNDLSEQKAPEHKKELTMESHSVEVTQDQSIERATTFGERLEAIKAAREEKNDLSEQKGPEIEKENNSSAEHQKDEPANEEPEKSKGRDLGDEFMM
jgi:conjugative relaxase-like TrwC/TraI family protein